MTDRRVAGAPTTRVLRALPSTEEEPGFLSRLGLIVALSALCLALADIGAVMLVHGGYLPESTWIFTLQQVAAEVAVILGAAGVGCHWLDVYRLLARHQIFDPRQFRRDLVIVDQAVLLARAQAGWALRVVLPAGLIVAWLALLLSVADIPFYDGFHVTTGAPPQLCAATRTLAPFRLELDNSPSAVSVSWSAQPVEGLPTGGYWAQIRPNQGKLAPGASRQIQVIPNLFVCNYVAGSAITPRTGLERARTHSQPVTTFHVLFDITGATTRQTTVGVPVLGPSGPQPTPTPAPTPTPPPSPTASHSATKSPQPPPPPPPPSPTPCPTLSDTIDAPAPNANFNTTVPGNLAGVQFIGSWSGCGAIPANDFVWQATNLATQVTTSGNGESTTLNLGPGTYIVYFDVTDPVTSQNAANSVTITVTSSCPQLQAQIDSLTNNETIYSDDVTPTMFTGSYSSNCGGQIPDGDMTWTYTLDGTTVTMGNGASISYVIDYATDPYTITFTVTDPTSGQTVSASVSNITVSQSA